MLFKWLGILLIEKKKKQKKGRFLENEFMKAWKNPKSKRIGKLSKATANKVPLQLDQLHLNIRLIPNQPLKSKRVKLQNQTMKRM